MNMHVDFTDAQNALGIVTPSFYNVETTVYQTKYPSYDYASLIPVITEGNEWAMGTLFRIGDIAGVAEFLSGKGFDMPYADVSIDQKIHSFELAGIGYEWSLEEIQRAAMEGRNLGNEKAMAAKKVAEAKLYNVALTGDTEKSWTGLLNDANVAATDVAANGAGSSTAWSDKTPAQIITDVFDAITGVYTSTSEVEMPNTLLLPTVAYQGLSRPRSDSTEGSVIDYIRKYNPYTQETGQPLLIRGIRALNAADPGGDGRAVLYNRSPDVVRFHLPMPHKFLPPFQKSSMTWEVGGIMRTGGTEVRLPGAMTYLDGIVINS